MSTVSPFFHSILIANVHQHPLIYLKGIRSDILRQLLRFLYLGSVEISQDNLEEFLD